MNKRNLAALGALVVIAACGGAPTAPALDDGGGADGGGMPAEDSGTGEVRDAGVRRDAAPLDVDRGPASPQHLRHRDARGDDSGRVADPNCDD